ncbi:hypothetical protein [Draconibacterium halophilum]|uniref:Uncharacterized protein n=1 Tax=Draconibacterium halophilum TaxID=2706887 RepID=A0A6C0R9L8_9BACT|nr:hypothetical protein [Draconibacterium halophilum]QIA06385.1 hypothetical protein G0Q07_00950 [Draconibacterium halophilum]
MIYSFAYAYADSHRDELSKLSSADEFENYMDKYNAFNEFVAYAKEKGVEKDAEGLKASGRVISTQIKAYVARNIMGEEGFYPIIKQIDKTLLRAIEVSQQNLMVENVVATDSVVGIN